MPYAPEVRDPRVHKTRYISHDAAGQSGKPGPPGELRIMFIVFIANNKILYDAKKTTDRDFFAFEIVQTR